MYTPHPSAWQATHHQNRFQGGEVKYGEGVAYLRSLYCARVNMLNGRIYSLSDPEPTLNVLSDPKPRYWMLSEPKTELVSL